ncbi:MAG TPA: hypothetical protein VJ301_12045 [Propionibacteriaceae bacterium]|nr:hypothetical protein [Propionibacteriaceae bacterium]
MTEPRVESRLVILPDGVRIVRLETGDTGWLREYHAILRVAAQDFLRRARLSGTGDIVCAELAELLEAGGAVWLVLDAQYRLLGFSAIRLGRAAFDRTLVAEVAACYLYPKRTPREVFPRLWAEMGRWAQQQGATTAAFQTRRLTNKAWTRQGARRVGAVYEVDLKGETDG